jgi:hypothetical protein
MTDLKNKDSTKQQKQKRPITVRITASPWNRLITAFTSPAIKKRIPLKLRTLTARALSLRVKFSIHLNVNTVVTIIQKKVTKSAMMNQADELIVK